MDEKVLVGLDYCETCTLGSKKQKNDKNEREARIGPVRITLFWASFRFCKPPNLPNLVGLRGRVSKAWNSQRWCNGAPCSYYHCHLFFPFLSSFFLVGLDQCRTCTLGLEKQEKNKIIKRRPKLDSFKSHYLGLPSCFANLPTSRTQQVQGGSSAKLGTSNDGVVELQTPIAIATFFFFFDICAPIKTKHNTEIFSPPLQFLSFALI